MTCAVCQLPTCAHSDLEYSGLAPARHAGAPTGRTCGAGTSIAPDDASPKTHAVETSFHGATIEHREANVCVG